MQEIIINLKVGSVLAELVDEYNQSISTLPSITRGLRALLRLRLFDAQGNPLSAASLAFVSWDFVLASDWNTETAPQIRVQTDISVVTVNEGDVNYTEIHIPLTETNTEELVAALGNSASINLGAELAGFEEEETVPGFLMQFDMTVRNRRGTAGTGVPVPVGDGIYSAAQVDTLLITKADVVHYHNDLYALIDHDHDGVYQKEDIPNAYNRTASVLASMMLFVRNGAVNAYLTLNDIREWLKATFSEITHNHDDTYAWLAHEHDYSSVYAQLNHAHDYSGVYAPLEHDHDYSDLYAPLEHQHGIKCAVGAGVVVGSLVYISDDAGIITCHLAGNTTNFADGYVASIDNGEAMVLGVGSYDVDNLLTAGTNIYLGLDGVFTDTAPSASGKLVQKVGRVINANTIYFNIQIGRTII
jgi:hypothetical protein